MIQKLTFAFIGGDPRQAEVIHQFAQEGYQILTFGLENLSFPEGLSIQFCDTLASCIHGADIVILPFPYTSDNETITTSFSSVSINTNDVLRQMNGTQLLLAGRVDKHLSDLASLYNVHLIDYGEREELLISNAIPTVEAALEIAIKETSHTIHNSHCLVLGYGRIGKILAKDLHALGAKTYVAARKHRDLSWIDANGYIGISFPDLINHIKNFDIIYNTVPTTVLDFPLLSQVNPSSLIIDLASKPGGVDFETAKILDKKVIWALSLPGKTAPKTAGNIIHNTIQNILEELGV